MQSTIRPRRSVLFVPAANPRALEKSDGLRPDGLIYDLEDSVSPEEKPAARERLRDHLEGSAFSGERIVRINGLDTPWGTEDFLMARGAGVDAILLPKVETARVVRQLVDALKDTDAPDSLKLWAMIETPLGILDAGSIAAEGQGRLGALVVGPNDIKLATGIRPDAARSEMLPWLMQIVLAAKAHGLSVLDGIYGDFCDTDGFADECASARRMGFDGKTLIHPSQIESAEVAFSPEPEAVRWAETVIAAFEREENQGKGVIGLDGRMVERLHLVEATRLIALRDAIAYRA
ncbi:MAG: CoA ester lyase [Fulvimarina manganoxydans]|uniref:HpcH/HpaI aldolase/citrate lyase family protein n=1 Tax=Fulvimarina manganoxydans TaxID=937218 RepID=UPI002353CAC2|nr:CoA ester lyase [Fulvimarina manganoxydans]MCK5934382.1 CoA ester lyase [Fulvimarina manganoxydans]